MHRARWALTGTLLHGAQPHAAHQHPDTLAVLGSGAIPATGSAPYSELLLALSLTPVPGGAENAPIGNEPRGPERAVTSPLGEKQRPVSRVGLFSIEVNSEMELDEGAVELGRF